MKWGAKFEDKLENILLRIKEDWDDPYIISEAIKEIKKLIHAELYLKE